jgi:biopolymer transport protein ExbD
MPKVKVNRKSVSLDMTAMCDMAFLLLTFFMLTTKFKPEEPLVVESPTSISETILQDTDVATISIGKDGRVFFSMEEQDTKEKMLEEMERKYQVTFNEVEKQEFKLLPTFGTPIGGIKQILNMSTNERNKVNQPGIPCDSTNNELKDWLIFARAQHNAIHNKALKIAIKGDKEANYEVVKRVIATLQEQNANRFNFITGLEAKPESMVQAEKAAGH